MAVAQTGLRMGGATDRYRTKGFTAARICKGTAVALALGLAATAGGCSHGDVVNADHAFDATAHATHNLVKAVPQTGWELSHATTRNLDNHTTARNLPHQVAVGTTNIGKAMPGAMDRLSNRVVGQH